MGQTIKVGEIGQNVPGPGCLLGIARNPIFSGQNQNLRPRFNSYRGIFSIV